MSLCYCTITAFFCNLDLGWSLSQACHYAVLKGKNRRVRRELHSIQRCQEEPAVPAPSPSETAWQKKKGPRKIFLGKRSGAAQGAGDKHCPLLRKQLHESHPCGGLCCPNVWIWGDSRGSVTAVSDHSVLESKGPPGATTAAHRAARSAGHCLQTSASHPDFWAGLRLK